MINEHDLTVKMLNIIRESENRDDSITLSGPEMSQEVKKFTNYFSGNEGGGMNPNGFGKLIVYPSDGNAVWSGDFRDGFHWEFSLNDKTIALPKNGAMDDDDLELLNKVKRFGDAWKVEWNERLRTDYNQGRNG
jgi:hypothetical protein